jgi:hypothetical protein
MDQKVDKKNVVNKIEGQIGHLASVSGLAIGRKPLRVKTGRLCFN